MQDPTEKAERLRQEAEAVEMRGWCPVATCRSHTWNWEEAEAAEAARQEMARHQRAAKRALLRDVRGFEFHFRFSESFRLEHRRRQKTRRTRSRDQAGVAVL